MVTISFDSIFVIVIYILPGYIVLYVTNIFTDYLHEKNTFDRIIHYLVFSFICYILSLITLAASFALYSLIGNMFYLDNLLGGSFLKQWGWVSLIALIYSPFIGFLLGRAYFNRGYPHRHFKKYTKKRYTPSVYAEMLKEYKRGAWLTFHMKDKTVIQGKFAWCDRDEEKRDYVFIITDANQYHQDIGEVTKLKGEKIIINLKDINMMQFNK